MAWTLRAAGPCSATFANLAAPASSLALLRNRGFVEASLRSSAFWEPQSQRDLAQQQEVEDTEYDACCCQADRARHHRLRHSVPEMCHMAAVCHHVHDPDHSDDDGASHAEPGYTARFAVAVALCATRWAIRVLDLPWEQPVLPRPVEHGRVYTRVDPREVRHPALPAALAEVGLAEETGEGSPTRLASVNHLRSLPAGAVYIGRGYRPLGLGKSVFCNPFRIGPHGDRAAVVAQFRAWVQTQPRILQRLPELCGKLLLCHCVPGLPCHGQVLLQLLSAARPED